MMQRPCERHNGTVPGDDVQDDELGEVEQELTQLFRSVGRLSRGLAAEVHPNIDGAAYAMLAIIDRTGHARIGELSETLGLHRSTVSRQVATLVRLGLLVRDRDPGDARSGVLTLSETGAARLRHAATGRRELLRSELRSWPRADLTELARLLHRLNESRSTH